MKHFLATLALSLSLTACGIEEECEVQAAKDPQGNAVTPASEYEGEHAEAIKEALRLAAEMGMSSDAVFIRTENEMVDTLGYCLAKSEDKRIILQPKYMPASETSDYLYLIAHEYAHCHLDARHENFGLMSPTVVLHSSWDFTLNAIKQFALRNEDKVAIDVDAAEAYIEALQAE